MSVAALLLGAALFVIAGLTSLGRRRRGGACGSCPSADRCGAADRCLHDDTLESDHVHR